MVDAAAERTEARLSGHADLSAEINANGSLRRFDCGDISLSLFVGNELEGGPANLYLRMVGDGARCIPLLGPQSPTCFESDARSGRFTGRGSWLDVEYALELVLSKSATAWFWHVQLVNRSAGVQALDLTYAQDLALAPYGAVRMNEFYVSQYVDHTPLSHPTRGMVVASRQNQLAGDRHPWTIVGSLRKGASFATDALQFHGLANREGAVTTQLAQELPNRRLQHEHSMVVVRDTAIRLEPSSSSVGRVLRWIRPRSSRGHVRCGSRTGGTHHRAAGIQAGFQPTEGEAESGRHVALHRRAASLARATSATMRCARRSRTPGGTRSEMSAVRCCLFSTAQIVTSFCDRKSCGCCGRTGICSARAAISRPTKQR